jgi:hypothetical protein
MNRRPDPVERLRKANPVLADDSESPETPQAKALLERIVRTDPELIREPRRPIRIRRWILIPVAILVLGAAGYVVFRHTDQPLFVACYQRASLSADRAELQPNGQDPVAACGVLWRPGAQFNPDGRVPTPELTACVLPTGAVGVFPGATGVNVCSALGLANPTANPTERRQDQAVQELQNALSNHFLNVCVGRSDALALAQQELHRLGLTGWQVSDRGPFTTRAPCASVAFDIPHRTVTIVPVSNPSSP